MENNRLKIVWILLFVLFSGISCWATAESLHMLLNSWPVFFCWVIAIGFFVIASYGTKLIVDSLNQNIYMEKRGICLIGGILIALVFWLVCSMPTNTHTFFYRTLIDKEVSTDINTTCAYLAQIKDNTTNKQKIQKQLDKLDNDIEIKLGELEAEIKNDLNPGFGPKAKEIFADFAKMLNVAKIDPLALGSTSSSKEGRKKLVDEYRKKIYALKEARKTSIKMTMIKPEQGMKDAEKAYNNLQIVKETIESQDFDLNNAEDIAAIRSKLNDGYTVINSNKMYVEFNTIEDEERYTASNVVTRVDHLTSVFDVWSDFFDGKYAGMGFGFWIVIAMLVDIAGFLFFDLAFKKTE